MPLWLREWCPVLSCNLHPHWIVWGKQYLNHPCAGNEGMVIVQFRSNDCVLFQCQMRWKFQQHFMPLLSAVCMFWCYHPALCVARVSAHSSVQFWRMKWVFYCNRLEFSSFSLAEKVHLSNAPVFLHWTVKNWCITPRSIEELFSAPWLFISKSPKILLTFYLPHNHTVNLQ